METCVAASCRMVASDVGVVLTEQTVATALNTTQGGASVLRSAEVLSSLGVGGGKALLAATLSQLETALSGGRSVIVGMHIPGIGRHAVVVDRIVDGMVYLRDPLPLAQGSGLAMPLGDFLSMWAGRMVGF